MNVRGRDVAVSLLVVGTAAAAGYVIQRGQGRAEHGPSSAEVGARVVDAEDVPVGATVVDASSRRLRELPGAGRAIDRAIADDAREEWAGVEIDREGAWGVVDALHRSLPYYEGSGGEYNGVYVAREDRVVVVDAIGWARVEESSPEA
ncbi:MULTISPECIES: hypothetical protein [Saliphagus]|uniref:Uncharacterized protein n=1 Tax=Saliphagus infecundisoli TaxID=1849069 RepID=A0ABD5QCF8_9EURY|nr:MULTISPECIES: hypothetical protein [Saliphagus]